MSSCKKCNAKFIPTKGLKLYCSLECRNSRTFSEEAKQKKSNSAKAHWNSLSGETRTKIMTKIVNSEKRKKAFSETYLKKYQAKSWEELGIDGKRRRVFEEQDHKCLGCGIGEWRGFPVPMELNHIDGNNQNNTRENLEGLCANCHGITCNWRGRNKTSVREKVDFTQENFVAAFVQEGTIRKALISMGLTGKGANYEKARQMLAVLAATVTVTPKEFP